MATIAFDRTGSGPAVVLLHPLGADRHVWDGVVSWLHDERECVTVDLPGFGESPPLEGDCDPAALATAIGHWMIDQGLVGAHAVGNSLGGWVALELARMGYARAVTAIAPAGLWPRPLLPRPSVARRIARSMYPLIGPATATGPGRRLLLAGVVADPRRVSASGAAHLIRSYARAPGFPAVNAAMRAGVFHGLGEITVPVTLIWGEHDTMVSAPRTLPPDVESIVLPDAGHIPQLELPAVVADLLRTVRDPVVGASDPAPAT